MRGQTVGFDLDLTLIDSRAGIAATYRALADRTGVRIDTDEILARLGPPLELELANWFPAEAVARAAVGYRELYPAYAISTSPLLAGAAEAVAAVRTSAARVLVITAKNERDARRHLDHLGVVADEVVGLAWEGGKTAALKTHDATVYVGDHTADMTAGRGAAVRTVGVTTGVCTVDDLYAAGADVVLPDLTGFPAWWHGYLGDSSWAGRDG